MNKKLQRVMTAGLAVLVGSGLFVTSVDAASLTKSLKAIYNNIKVTYDGESVTPNMEPFMVDGTVYVSLRDAGQITGNKVDWRNNTVHITPEAGSVDQSALDAKQREVDFWKTKADALEKQLNELKDQGTSNGGTVVKPGDTAAMEKKLLEIFDEELNVAWEFDIRQHTSKDILYVTVSYSSKSDKRDFDNITTKKLETFLKEVSFEVQQAFKGFTIEGALEDSYKDVSVGDFTYSTSGKFAYTKVLTSSDIREITNDLNSKYRKLPAMPLGAESATALTISSIDLKLKDDAVIYTVNIPQLTQEQMVGWNKLTDYDVEDLLIDFLDDIEYDIDDEIKYDSIVGYIFSGNTKLVTYEDQDFSRRKMYE
ncbi:MAG: stalk domain-containing protein [Cellulosilyticaceae bacterium]